jgi:creatinine amidohydrolase
MQMLMKLCTWPEVERYLQDNCGIVVPIGSTEQHGPNGLIGTDFITAEFIAEEVGRLTGCLVAPTMTVGSAQHHLGFPGTISVRPSTMVATLVDWINSLSKHGFTRIFFINGHGGNIAPTQTAISEFYANFAIAPGSNAAPTLCRLANWWVAPRTAKFIDDLYGSAEGMHATASEVSLAQYAYPEAIKAMPPGSKPALAATHNDIHDAVDYRRRFIDGRIGSDPGRSNPDDGKKIYEIAAKELAEQFEAFRLGD